MLPEGATGGVGWRAPHHYSRRSGGTADEGERRRDRRAERRIHARGREQALPADVRLRSKDMSLRRHKTLRTRQLGESGLSRRRREMIGGVKQASVRWARCVRKATRGWLVGTVNSVVTLDHTAAATAPPPPQSLHLR